MKIRTLFVFVLFISIMVFSACSFNNNNKEIITITGQDIENYRISSFKKYTDAEVIEILTEREVLIREADNRGISPTPQEIENYIIEHKTIFDNMTEEQKQVIYDFIKSTNITIDQYWHELITETMYRKAKQKMMKDAINKEISDEILINHPKWTQSEVREGADKMYKEKVEKIRRKYKIIIE